MRKAERYNLESERALLGAAILESKAADEMIRRMTAQHFWSPQHQQIFEVIKAIRMRGGDPDLVTVKHGLDARGELEDVGGVAYLIQLAEAVPSASNAGYYADLVSQDWRYREVIKRGKELVALAEKGDWPEAVKSGLGVLHGLADDGTFEYDVADVVESLDEEDLPGVPSFFDSVNSSLRLGGYPRGEVTIIGAPTGVGKTLVMCQDIGKSCDDGLNVAAVTLEMSCQAIMRRIAKQQTGFWSIKEAHRFSDHHGQEFAAWQKSVALDWSLSFYDTSLLADSEITVADVCAWVKHRHEIAPLDLVYVDYAQLLTGGRGEEWQRQASVSRALRALAKRLGIAVVALVQIEQDAASRNYQIRGSREYGKDAAMTLFLTYEKMDGEDFTWLNCVKNRHGKNKWRTELRMEESRVRLLEAVSVSEPVYRGGE